jgi:soluble lytic murein transglycosylase-like protein
MPVMQDDTIIYTPSMRIGLWILVFIMILAVYIPNANQDHPRQNLLAKAAVLDQIIISPLTDFAIAALNDVHPSSLPSPNSAENQLSTEPLQSRADKTIKITANLADQNEDLVSYGHVKKSERLYQPIILKAANRYQVDPAIVKAIIMAESSYNPKAVSKRGAKGLMQLMPKTAMEMGVKDIFNPEHNINGGVRYYKKLLKEVNGDIKLALAAYNAGLRTVKKHNGIPPFKATRYYIKKVFKYYQHYKKQMEMKQA